MFTLLPLPFENSMLAPHLSAKTLDFHYGRHHQTYVDNLNKLIVGTELEKLSLVEIMIKVAGQSEQIAVFNNAAQVYNHDFFWKSLCPVGHMTQPAAELLAAISKDFISLDNFYSEFKALALSQFGSGWVWLVKDGQTLKIVKTTNADNPLIHGQRPLLTVDVWEHAYYLDYQNRRADYLEAVIRNLLNWDFAAQEFNAA